MRFASSFGLHSHTIFAVSGATTSGSSITMRVFACSAHTTYGFFASHAKAATTATAARPSRNDMMVFFIFS